MAMKNKMRNIFQVSRGKAKEAAGNATGDSNLVTDGLSDQKEGNLKQAGEKVKDAFRKH